MNPESNLQKKCIEYLKSKKIYYINQYGNGRTGKGTPDITACINGRYVAFELKVEGNAPSPAQIIRMKKIRESGGIACAFWTFDDFKKKVDEVITWDT